MSRFLRRPTEASLRAAERRKREDESARLRDEVPALTELRLELEERQGGNGIAAARHTRYIPVASAPAMFEILCTDTSCKDGGHDLTRELLRALRTGTESFECESPCNGQLGAGSCSRVLHCSVRAKYRAEA